MNKVEGTSIYRVQINLGHAKVSRLVRHNTQAVGLKGLASPLTYPSNKKRICVPDFFLVFFFFGGGGVEGMPN